MASVRAQLLDQQAGKFDLLAFQLTKQLTKLCDSKLQLLRQHLQEVKKFDLEAEGDASRNTFVDATIDNIHRLLSLPSVATGSIASLVSSVENSVLRQEELEQELSLIVNANQVPSMSGKFQVRDKSKEAAEIALQVVESNTNLGNMQRVDRQPLPPGMCNVNPQQNSKDTQIYREQLRSLSAKQLDEHGEDAQMQKKLATLLRQERQLKKSKANLQAELANLEGQLASVSQETATLQIDIKARETASQMTKAELESKIARSENLHTCEVRKAQVIPVVLQIDEMVRQVTSGAVSVQLRKLSSPSVQQNFDQIFESALEKMTNSVYQYATSEATCIDLLCTRCKQAQLKLYHKQMELDEYSATGILADARQELGEEIDILKKNAQEDMALIRHFQQQASTLKAKAMHVFLDATKHITARKRGMSQLPHNAEQRFHLVLERLQLAISSSPKVTDADRSTFTDARGLSNQLLAEHAPISSSTVTIDREAQYNPAVRSRRGRGGNPSSKGSRPDAKGRPQQRGSGNSKGGNARAQPKTPGGKGGTTPNLRAQPQRSGSKGGNSRAQPQKTSGKSTSTANSRAQPQRSSGKGTKPRTQSQQRSDRNQPQRKQQQQAKPTRVTRKSKPTQQTQSSAESKQKQPASANTRKDKPQSGKASNGKSSAGTKSTRKEAGSTNALPQRAPRRVRK